MSASSCFLGLILAYKLAVAPRNNKEKGDIISFGTLLAQNRPSSDFAELEAIFVLPCLA